MQFNYMKQETYMDSIEIDDIGKVNLEAINDDAEAWYLHIESHLGWTGVIQMGPFEVDSNTPCPYFNFNRTSFEFNQKKVYKIINDFINNPKRQITQLYIVGGDVIIDKLDGIRSDIECENK